MVKSNKKLEDRYNGWKLKFEVIENETIPYINDMLIELDFAVDKSKAKEIYEKIAEIEIKLYEIKAKIEGFGAQNVIGGGGRYNGMIECLGGPETPAIGFAAGFDRLMLALEKENVKIPIQDSCDLFLLYVSEDEKKYAFVCTFFSFAYLIALCTGVCRERTYHFG